MWTRLPRARERAARSAFLHPPPPPLTSPLGLYALRQPAKPEGTKRGIGKFCQRSLRTDCAIRLRLLPSRRSLSKRHFSSTPSRPRLSRRLLRGSAAARGANIDSLMRQVFEKTQPVGGDETRCASNANKAEVN